MKKNRDQAMAQLLRALPRSGDGTLHDGCPDAEALAALAHENIPFTVLGTMSYEQELAALRSANGPAATATYDTRESMSGGTTMTLTIELPKDAERRLRKHAERSGVDAAVFAARLIEHGLRLADASGSPKTFEQIFAPLTEAFAEGNLSDEEFDALMEEAREEACRERTNQP
jgi:hypothetical protein